MTQKESSARAREKRANLSSGLLVAKDIPSLATVRAVAVRREVIDDPAPVEATPDAPIEAPVSVSNLSVSNSSVSNLPPADTVLSRKGSASAAGFRPDYWSYDHRAAARALDETPAVVPLFQGSPAGRAETVEAESAPELGVPAAVSATEMPAGTPSPERSPAASPPSPTLTRSSLLVIAFGFFAVIASASLTWLAPSPSPAPSPAPEPRSSRTEAPQPVPPSAQVVAQPPAVSAPPVSAPSEAAAPPSIVADLESPMVARPEDSEHADAKVSATAFAEPFPVAAVIPPSPAPGVSASAPDNIAPQDIAPGDIAIVTTAPPDRIDDEPALPAPGVAVTPSPVLPLVSAEETAALVARGDQLLATGDIAAARLFYQRAAEQGSGAAALAIGKTNDPLYLVEAHVRGIRGDVAAAASWYRRAFAAGEPQGQIRLDRLLRAFPEAGTVGGTAGEAPRQAAP